MRNTKDIADAVFRIRDEYLEQKKKKRIRIEKACATVSAIAAAGLITVGAVNYFSYSQPLKDNEVISFTDATTVLPTETVTTVYNASEHTITYTTAVSETEKKAVTTVSSASKSTSSVITSAVSHTNSNAVSPVIATTAQTADTTVPQIPITTDLSDIDCKEVIRMKVVNVKKYLAALSAAAMASSGAVQMPANAEAMYTPKPFGPLTDAVLYIEDNLDKMDFDGSGKLDIFDSYALFTFMNEPQSLPEGYAARCAAYGDFNKDGAVDTLDTDLLREVCELRYMPEDYGNYIDNTEYLLPANTDPVTHVHRTVSPDAPDELREKLLHNVYVDESYTYGSDENKNSFIDYFFYDLRSHIFPNEYTFDKYNDAYYKRFVENYDADKYSFDINEDGVVDLKDLYDIYIYEVASADEGGPICKEGYFAQFNNVEKIINGQTWIVDDKDNPLRKRLPMSEEFKQHLWDKCEPLYDYVYSSINHYNDDMYLCDQTVFEVIARYIVSNTELDMINMSSLYYVQYHGDLILCDHSLSDSFRDELSWILNKFFNKSDSQNNNIYERKQSEKYHTAIADHDYMHDNDIYRALIDEAKGVLKSGLKNDMFDINKDGEINYLDSYVFELYINDLAKGITAEESILPAVMWNFIDRNVELDNDDIPGTFGDFMLFQAAVGWPFEQPQYKLDIYYLQLLEKKGLVDLSDIRPYIEQLCKDKEAGDVDLDGKLTAVDSCEVLKYYSQMSVEADISPVTEAKMEYLADYNGDGAIDSVDASSILTTYSENSVQK
ncbi:dockerin type I domain-containing protein [Ruminococcus flavefaciens]|uniref:Dockerin domain-containing protein n=1 Tax=Ruminococcus flavefaciens TaxID=1265 RepID=A0A1M7HNH3_RUMFL|nr:dockerin type I domain-containing protein [Ruminococcus flavefaciens]SHM30066.1 hypothetical protein SAMN04487860_1032 [Ruminococcus flavefaciens]